MNINSLAHNKHPTIVHKSARSESARGLTQPTWYSILLSACHETIARSKASSDWFIALGLDLFI